MKKLKCIRVYSIIYCCMFFSMISCEYAPPDFIEARMERDSISQGIYYGTRDPQNVSLTDGQMLAIGWFFSPGNTSQAWCSGTLIAPRVVASADHCLQGIFNLNQVGFGVGTYPTNPGATFSIEEVYRHSHLDIAMFVLSEDATIRVPGLTPINMNHQNPNQWLNQALDASGYGQTHDGSTGRFFASVWLERVNQNDVVVNGRGQQGICFGDSGGPLIAPGPVVVAVESHGDASCVGRDTMIRLDAVSSWIEPILSRYGELPDNCGDLDYLGRCNGNVAEWCQDGHIQSRDCAADGMVCGYIDNETGYYCMDADTDPCQGFDYEGQCINNTAQWCENELLYTRDCSSEGMICDYVNNYGYRCVQEEEDPCNNLDYLGRCNGNIAEWCQDGEFMSRDCAAEGKVCGFVNEDVGYYCMDEPGPDYCEGISYRGQCTGNIAQWCQDGYIKNRNCSIFNEECGYDEVNDIYRCLKIENGNNNNGASDPTDTDHEWLSGCSTSGSSAFAFWFISLFLLIAQSFSRRIEGCNRRDD